MEAGISTGRASITRKDSTDVIADMGLTESDMQDPELLKELRALGYVEAVTKPTTQKKQTNKAPLSLKVRMNEYKSKALQAKKAGDLENAKKYYKEFKILRAQIENQGKKKINVKQGQSKVVANSVHNKTSSSHPPQSHPKALKSLTADSASLNEADIDNVELTEDDMVDPDLLRELKMMGYKETKPVNDDKKSLEDTMNEYKSKALQAKELAIWRMQKSIIKSLKF